MTDTLHQAAAEAAELDDKARAFFAACANRRKTHGRRHLSSREARRIVSLRKDRTAAREAKEAEKGLAARQDEVREAAAAQETL